jgi:aspartyl protease family protein
MRLPPIGNRVGSAFALQVLRLRVISLSRLCSDCRRVSIGALTTTLRRGRTTIVQALSWALVFECLINLYLYRSQLGDTASYFLAAVSPGVAVSDWRGGVMVSRTMDGQFLVRAKVNAANADFIFDTGASTVTLTQRTAMQAGFDTSKLKYSNVIATANGRTRVAPVVLDRMTIGDITEEKVPAMVAQPGSLDSNLLGMSFLNRLSSYEVQNDRLVFRGRRGGSLSEK